MELKKYLKSSKVSVAEFAKLLDVTAQYLWIVVNGLRRPSESLALKVEQLTNGEVKADEVRLPCGKCPTCHREYETPKPKKRKARR